MTTRLGPDGRPAEPAGIFRVGETVGVDYHILRMDAQVVRVFFRIESQDRVFPVTQPEPETGPGRFLFRLQTQGGQPGLYAFALLAARSGQPAPVLLIPFALQ